MAVSEAQRGSQARAVLGSSVRAFWEGIDKPLLVSACALVAYGLLVIYSASLSIPEAAFPRQAVGAVLGLFAAGVCYRFDYRRLAAWTVPLFVADCLLMVAPLVPFLSYDANGITGWIQIPVIGYTFQTSELAKP